MFLHRDYIRAFNQQNACDTCNDPKLIENAKVTLSIVLILDTYHRRVPQPPLPSIVNAPAKRNDTRMLIGTLQSDSVEAVHWLR